MNIHKYNLTQFGKNGTENPDSLLAGPDGVVANCERWKDARPNYDDPSGSTLPWRLHSANRRKSASKEMRIKRRTRRRRWSRRYPSALKRILPNFRILFHKNGLRLKCRGCLHVTHETRVPRRVRRTRVETETAVVSSRTIRKTIPFVEIDV